MNIQPVTADAVRVPFTAGPKVREAAPKTSGASGQEQTSRKELLTQALASEPDFRPAVLSQAQQQAADPDYPGPNVMAKFAAWFARDAKGN